MNTAQCRIYNFSYATIWFIEKKLHRDMCCLDNDFFEYKEKILNLFILSPVVNSYYVHSIECNN